ncbi:hypothetical protein NA57DRAFT_55008 [Rhizodiscina lignyota]|uniref:Uncharacterized protein n=1 Tax=Rhizodiscina lignyota TaxID=1504668 RepID=A0A9P4IMN9_9PEZI|nr:hypothetical protein NA57DRAFT_55008 [Rhizodiscina lignyota]
MEVHTAAPLYSSNGFGQSEAFNSTDAGAMDVDEMDIDLTGDPELVTREDAAITQSFGSEPPITGISPAAALSAEMETDAAPDKVFIWGLDDLTTEDIERFVSEYYPTEHFVKVQWINDQSANIIYTDSEAATQALIAFTDDSQVDLASIQPREARRAKPLSWRDTPGDWTVRQATVADKKVPRAREQSRFYLMNPDKDPKERRERNDARRDERGDYKRRRFDDREHRRRRDGDRFDVNMYDDDAGEVTYSNRSTSADGRKPQRRARRGSDDLFGGKAAGRAGGRLRNRSASPLRDGDGRMGFEDDQPRRRTARQRSVTPEHLRRPVDRDYSQSNTGKELFPASGTTSGLTESDGAAQELFPNKSSPVKAPKELFPHRTPISNHRRTAAFDAADETSKYSKPRSLAERITGGPRSNVHDRPVSRTRRDEEQGFDIRGAASPGFNIRGAAADASSVKELFPLKAGPNAGKELFGEKIKGRGGARRKAEDMF